MKRLFLPYNLCVIAKEKGFNDMCFGFYPTSCKNPDLITPSDYKETFHFYNRPTNTLVLAPTHQQITDWFREKHNILIYVVPFKDHASDVNDSLEWNWAIHNKKIGRGITTYYEALTKAIEEAFKLIK